MAVVLMSNNYQYINEFVKFAIKYGFNAIMFQQYISYGDDDTLKLTKEQEIFVIRSIKYLKELSYRKEIPLEIITKYNLSKENIQNYKENDDVIDIEQFNNIKVCNEYKLSETKKDFNSEMKSDFIKIKKECTDFTKIDDIFEEVEDNNTDKLICVAPWESIFLGPNCIQFSSYCRNLNRNIEEMWNSKEAIEWQLRNPKNSFSRRELTLAVNWLNYSRFFEDDYRNIKHKTHVGTSIKTNDKLIPVTFKTHFYSEEVVENE